MNVHSDTGFSLFRYYGGKHKSDLLSNTVVVILSVLILWSPLPFGSVEPDSLYWIELIAGTCFFIWIIKLFLMGNREQLELFRSEWRQQQLQKKRAPFFYRHLHIARILNLLTLGKWPSRNQTRSVEVLGANYSFRSFPYYSFLGHPIRKTGLESVGLIFLALLLIQIVPLPATIVSVISPTAKTFYSSAASAAGVTATVHPLTLNGYLTSSRVLQYTAYFMIFLTSVNVVRTRWAYRTLIFSIIASSLFQTCYGLYELFSGKQQIFEYQKQFFLNCASGTFINRNHFCPFIGISVPLLFAVLLGSGAVIRPSSGSFFVRLSRIMENESGKFIFWLMVIACVLSGVFFSFSLTGIAAVSLSIFAFLVLFQRIRRKNVLLLVSILLTLSVVTGVFASAFLKSRLGGLELMSERSRFMAWKDAGRIFLNFPVVGTGSGTFGEVFPAFRSFQASAKFTHAHNELLEALAENGVAMVFFLLIFLDVLASRLRRILKTENVRRMHLLQVACFCSVLMLIFDNLVDFSFEIPAIAVTGIIVLALFFASYYEETRAH